MKKVNKAPMGQKQLKQAAGGNSSEFSQKKVEGTQLTDVGGSKSGGNGGNGSSGDWRP